MADTFNFGILPGDEISITCSVRGCGINRVDHYFWARSTASSPTGSGGSGGSAAGSAAGSGSPARSAGLPDGSAGALIQPSEPERHLAGDEFGQLESRSA